MAGRLEEFVRKLNIQRYKALLLIERDEERRRVIRSLLAAEEVAGGDRTADEDGDNEPNAR